ncbi:MAG: hypothetical protein AAB388_01465 [Patescibacteria group bacterium]
MSNVKNHPAVDENFIWTARGADVEGRHLAALQTFFNGKLEVTNEEGTVTIKATDRTTQHQLDAFMSAAILFQRRRVAPSQR